MNEVMHQIKTSTKTRCGLDIVRGVWIGAPIPYNNPRTDCPECVQPLDMNDFGPTFVRPSIHFRFVQDYQFGSLIVLDCASCGHRVELKEPLRHALLAHQTGSYLIGFDT
jgi:hypothetical protein